MISFALPSKVLRAVVCLFVGGVMVVAGTSARATPVDDLMDALRIREVLENVRDQSHAEGAALELEMTGRKTPGMAQALDRIHRIDVMYAILSDVLRQKLDGQDLSSLIGFFEDPQGAEIVALEIQAQAALLDPDIEALARDRFRQAHDAGAPRLDLFDRFIDANDVIERNVANGLTATLSFYQGLSEGGALPLSEREMLQQVWSSEPDIRAEISEYIPAFMLVMFAPLDDSAIRAYTEITRSDPGQRLNAALFDAYGELYKRTSFDVGLALARAMTVQDL